MLLRILSLWCENVAILVSAEILVFPRHKIILFSPLGGLISEVFFLQHKTIEIKIFTGQN